MCSASAWLAILYIAPSADRWAGSENPPWKMVAGWVVSPSGLGGFHHLRPRKPVLARL